MENRKPLNFAQALRSKPPVIATEDESQLSTAAASRNATAPASQLAATVDRQIPTGAASQPASALDSEQATKVDTRPAANPESPQPPESLIPTTTHESAISLSTKRNVASRKRIKVDSRKGDRHRGDKVPFNNRLSEAVISRIKHFCVDHNMEQQEFVELAAIHFIDSVESQLAAKGDSKLASDERDLMIKYKTEPRIINLYLQYNPQNRWRVADDAEGQRYNNKDIRLIEVGIIQTQFNAQFKKINSFKYYMPEIEIALETPLASETIDIMLRHGRRRWSEAAGN